MTYYNYKLYLIGYRKFNTFLNITFKLISSFILPLKLIMVLHIQTGVEVYFRTTNCIHAFFLYFSISHILRGTVIMW